VAKPALLNRLLQAGQHAFPGLSYIPGNSFIYRLHPWAKVGSLVLFSIAVFACSAWSLNLALLALLLLLYASSGLGFLFFWQKLRFILIFASLILLLQSLLGRGGQLWFELQWGWLHLQIWSEGFKHGLLLMLRFVNIIASSYLFVATSNPHQLVYGLMQTGMPYRYGFMLVTALRFIPVFQQEINLIRNAQMAKGIELEGASLRNLFQTVRFSLVPLVISSLNKVGVLVISMEGRAFGAYNQRSFLLEQRFRPRDGLVLVSALCLLVFILWLDHA